MDFEVKENDRRYDPDFQNEETTFRNQESFCLYDSITICSDQEISQYFRGQSNNVYGTMKMMMTAFMMKMTIITKMKKKTWRAMTGHYKLPANK